MDTWVWIAIAAAVVALIVIALIAWTIARRRRTKRLKGEFGPEYERLASERGKGAAESELEARQERAESFSLRPLLADEAQRFMASWGATQTRFVDEPGGAVMEADRLVGEVMRARGYPVGDFEQRAADVSVEHPEVVANYRTAHSIAKSHSLGQATTEQLRQAMVHYRALFTELLETTPPQRAQQADTAGR